MRFLRSFLESLAKRRKAFQRLGILVLVNAIVFVAVTYRLANKQERLAARRAELGFELEQKQRELTSVSNDATRAARNAEAVTRFWGDIVKPRAPGLTEAWDEIDRLAGQTNVSRGRTSYSREILDVGLEEIRANMPVEGNYFDLVRFINRLERSERFFLVDEITISQRESGDLIRLDCSIAFYLKPETLSEVAGP